MLNHDRDLFEPVEEFPHKVLFRIVRRDNKGRPFGTPRNPNAPTIQEFNPRYQDVAAGDLAALIVAMRHGILPEQAAVIAQMSDQELLMLRTEDPISATQIEGGLSLTGGHHRVNEIIHRVNASRLNSTTVVRILIHD